MSDESSQSNIIFMMQSIYPNADDFKSYYTTSDVGLSHKNMIL